MKKLGRFIKGVSLVFCATALLRACLSGMSGRQSQVDASLVTLGFGVMAYVLGAWIASASAANGVKSVKSRWWGASYFFRLAAFLAFAWIIGAYVLQDDYDRSLTLVFGPPLGIAVLLLGHSLLVVAPNHDSSPQTTPALGAGELAQVSPAEPCEMSLEDQAAMLNPAQRQRRMDELIARMKDQ